MKLNKQYIISELKKEKEFLKEKFGVLHIQLFGSYARNEQTEESDIDFLVRLNKPSYDQLFELNEYLEKKFNKKCDIVRMRKSIKKSFVEKIEDDLIDV